MSLAAAFGAIRRALDAAGVAYAIGGSWASTAHGEPRATNNLDLIADFTIGSMRAFLLALGPDFYVDEQQALEALGRGRAFNVIDQPMVYKFDFFPLRSEHGVEELSRRQLMAVPLLSPEPVPVVTAEDTVIVKLRWYREGGEASEMQWRDILGVVRAAGESLDFEYVAGWATRLGLAELWRRARDAAGGVSPEK